MSSIVPPVQCPVCHSMVPGSDRFCRRCGAPLWGRVFAPVQVVPLQYGQPTHRSRLPLLTFFAALLVLLVILTGVVGGIAVATRTHNPTLSCRLSCNPITGPSEPVAATYTDPTLGYSFSYLHGFTAQANGSGAATVGDGTSVILVSAQTGTGSDLSSVISAEVTNLAGNNLVQMQRLYDIAGASIGEVNGQATVYDAYLQAGDGTTQHVRVAIVAATHANLTALVVLVSPYDPSAIYLPSGMVGAQAADVVLLSFGWPGGSAH
jgi:hypothetical protein